MQGGGLYFHFSTATITSSTVHGNSAYNSLSPPNSASFVSASPLRRVENSSDAF